MAIATVPEPKQPPLSESFEKLFTEHSRMIYRTAYGVTGSREDAQDILQTVFLKLLRRDLPIKFRENPKAYLYRAAVNLSLDAMKIRRRRRVVDDADLEDMPSAEVSIRDESHARVYEAVAALAPKYREIVILRYVHEYSDAQIARMLGKSRAAVAVSLFRSRALLKKILKTPRNEE